MALSFDVLSGGLRRVWLPGERGPWPSTARESGERFATAVVQWFALAQAGPAVCVTVVPKRAPLAAGAARAFEAWTAPAAGALLAQAVAGYLTGHLFTAPAVTPGTSGPPVALAPATADFIALFSDLDLSLDGRARRAAAACTALASSTLVVFAPTAPPLVQAPPAFVA